jgi:ATP-dependent DNA helicase Q5
MNTDNTGPVDAHNTENSNSKDTENFVTFKTSFQRMNLVYNVMYMHSEYDVTEHILHTLLPTSTSTSTTNAPSNSTQSQSQAVPKSIIYCSTRQKAEHISNILKQRGINASPYHAGLSKERRKQVLDIWCDNTPGMLVDGTQKRSSIGDKKSKLKKRKISASDTSTTPKTPTTPVEKIDVITATISFGLGIDKANVRYVFHFDVPATLEGYYQVLSLSHPLTPTHLLTRIVLYRNQAVQEEMVQSQHVYYTVYMTKSNVLHI